MFETYWTRGRGVEVMAPTYGLLDMTAHGRQERWEDSPAGWPRRWGADGERPYRTDGRPTAQWSRLRAGRSDDLGTPVRSSGDVVMRPRKVRRRARMAEA